MLAISRSVGKSVPPGNDTLISLICSKNSCGDVKFWVYDSYFWLLYNFLAVVLVLLLIIYNGLTEKVNPASNICVLRIRFLI